jgi:penicillin amidase
MELMRRIGSGTLAEMVGQPGVKIDRLVRTLGLPKYALQSAQEFRENGETAIQQSANAYFDGINAFIHQGNTPEELELMGIEPQPYAITDAYYVMGAMALGFAMAQKTEPVTSEIHHKLGKQYLDDIGLWHGEKESFTPWSGVAGGDSVLQKWSAALSAMEHEFPALSFSGSNSWAISGERTASGGAMLCNDTHIAFNLPQTWYEAHVVSPGHDIQGHYMAAIPFALIGQDDHKAWGLTMLLNDDMDFYQERNINGKDSLYAYGDTVMAYSLHTENIVVKDMPDTVITIFESIHGPVINQAFSEFENQDAVSIYWAYTRLGNRNLQALYQINHSNNIKSFEHGAMMIHGPGLNITYADTAGHIGWWAAARFMKRSSAGTSWAIMDGSDPANDPAGFIEPELNPRNIDPVTGIIISANDWPEAALDSLGNPFWYPGYYKPQYRADRIRKLLNSSDQWDLLNMQSVMTDVVNEVDAGLTKGWKNDLSNHPLMSEKSIRDNFNWDGTYRKDILGPLLFNTMNYELLKMAMADELGETLFHQFLKTHQMQRCMSVLNVRRQSEWWDDARTPSKESYEDILSKAFEESVRKLREKANENPENWLWRSTSSKIKQHSNQKHPLGEIGALSFYNMSCEQDGGNETIRQAGFVPDSLCEFNIYFGSQMRIIADLKQREYWYNCTPAGQSGHIMSDYYRNQNEAYLSGKFFKRYKLPLIEKQQMFLVAASNH